MKTKRRLYLPNAALAAGAEIVLDAAQSHYLISVLRLGAGAEVHLFNAECGEWAVRIQKTENRRQNVAVIVSEQTRTCLIPHTSCLTLAFAPLKKDRMDFLVEKASELGVHFLQPVITDHTQSDRVKTERLQATAIEAAEQCDRLDAPTVLPPVKLVDYLHSIFSPLPAGRGSGPALPDEFVRQKPEAGGEGGVKNNIKSSTPPHPALRATFSLQGEGNILFLAAERGEAEPMMNAFLPHGLCRTNGQAQPVSPLPSHAHFLIGPEGGFSDKEFAMFGRYPAIRRIRLGPRLLRAETAAVAVLSSYQAIAGDWK